MLRATRIIVSTALATTLCFTGARAANYIAQSMPQQFPAAYQHLRAIMAQVMPPSSRLFDANSWLGSYKIIQFNGQSYLYGAFCKPHDCGANQLSFLTAESGADAEAVYVSYQDTYSRPLWLGQPNAQEKALLNRMIDWQTVPAHR